MAVLVNRKSGSTRLAAPNSSDLGKPEVPCHSKFFCRRDGKSWMTGTSPVETAGVD